MNALEWPRTIFEIVEEKMRHPVIIGFTGPLAAGKGICASVLTGEYEFQYYSLSHRVREIASSRGIDPVTRKILQDIGDELRLGLGGDILAKLTAALAFVEEKSRITIDGIRNPAEVIFLKRHPHFRLVAVTAPREKRYEFLLSRNRTSDPKTWEEFVTRDERDWGVGQDTLGNNVGACVALADLALENTDSPETLQATFRKIVSVHIFSKEEL